MTTFNFKKIVSVILIVAVAVATGFSIGKIYVSTLEQGSVVAASEQDLRDSEETIEKLYQNSLKANPSSFSALELFQIAEYKLNHAENFYKVMTGDVKALVVTQIMKSQKLKRGNTLVFNKYSPGSSFVEDICTQTRYNYDTDEISINKGTFISKETATMKGNFPPENATNYTMEEYKEIFNTKPSSILSYIISSKTCPKSSLSSVTKNSDGSYSFSINLEKDYLTMAALFYSYEIKFSSGLPKAPTWVSLSMEVKVDENFNFKTIDYVENYKMSHPLAGSVTVIDVFHDDFYFDDVPSFEEVM